MSECVMQLPRLSTWCPCWAALEAASHQWPYLHACTPGWLKFMSQIFLQMYIHFSYIIINSSVLCCINIFVYFDKDYLPPGVFFSTLGHCWFDIPLNWTALCFLASWLSQAPPSLCGWPTTQATLSATWMCLRTTSRAMRKGPWRCMLTNCPASEYTHLSRDPSNGLKYAACPVYMCHHDRS